MRQQCYLFYYKQALKWFAQSVSCIFTSLLLTKQLSVNLNISKYCVLITVKIGEPQSAVAVTCSQAFQVYDGPFCVTKWSHWSLAIINRNYSEPLTYCLSYNKILLHTEERNNSFQTANINNTSAYERHGKQISTRPLCVPTLHHWHCTHCLKTICIYQLAW